MRNQNTYIQIQKHTHDNILLIIDPTCLIQQGDKNSFPLPANNVLLVQMSSDVVRLVRGMGIQNVQWSVEGNMINKFKVMTIQVPQIRSDQNGKSGIVHLS